MVVFGLVVMFALAALILWSIYTYNTFKDFQTTIDFWQDEVDTHLRLRRELIPSLLDRARPLMGDETATLERIAGIREKIVNEAISETRAGGESEEAMERLENSLSDAMRALQSAFKKRREVQTNTELLTVMGELASIEGRAISACKEHNKLTVVYNGSIKSFPANLVVGLLHFNPREMRIFGDEAAAPSE